MNLLAPCIFEGRSELRNLGRVNCKTHWSNFGLRNTLLTERICHSAVVYILNTAVRLVECALPYYIPHTYFASAVVYCLCKRQLLKAFRQHCVIVFTSNTYDTHMHEYMLVYIKHAVSPFLGLMFKLFFVVSEM